MAEVLTCPTCSAPLDYPAGGGLTVHCPYCHNTVLLSDIARPQTGNSAEDLTAQLGPMIGKALEIAQVVAHLKAGNKIQAIKVYRQTFNVDLSKAKTAVENLAAGRTAPVSGAVIGRSIASDVTKRAAAGLTFGCGLAIAIMTVTGIFVALALRSAHRQIELAQQRAMAMQARSAQSAQTAQSAQAIRRALLATPPASTFAHMTLQFGSEGIGAGQFKDSRSIAVDGAGHIYVGECSDGRVQVFDPQGKFITVWSIGTGKTLLNLAANRRGTVYAVVPSHILAFEGVTGAALGDVEVTNGDVQEFYMDACVALNGDIYAIGGNAHIVILNSDGKIKNTIDAGEKVGENVSLFRIAVNGLGEIFALDREKGVFKFAADGRYINRFGGGSDRHRPDSLSAAHGLGVDGRGHVYVSTSGPAIRVFDDDGHYVDSFGGNDVVFGVAINDQSEILACYRNQHVVRKFVLEKN